jgi:hypothetical protein
MTEQWSTSLRSGVRQPATASGGAERDLRGGGKLNRWPLERVLFAAAGTMTLASVALGAFVSPWWLLLTAFVGVSQWLYVTVGECPASLAIERLAGVQRQCPRWR